MSILANNWILVIFQILTKTKNLLASKSLFNFCLAILLTIFWLNIKPVVIDIQWGTLKKRNNYHAEVDFFLNYAVKLQKWFNLVNSDNTKMYKIGQNIR